MSKKPKKAKASEQEKALAERGVKEWNDFVRRGKPLQDDYIQKVQNLDSDARKAEVRGIGSANVAQQTAGQGRGILQQAMQSGATAGSGRSLMARAGANISTGTIAGKTAAGAVKGTVDAKTQGLHKLSKFGRGVADSSRIDLAAGANRANDVANAEELANIAKTQNLLTAGGAALGAYSAGKDLGLGKTQTGSATGTGLGAVSSGSADPFAKAGSNFSFMKG